MNGINKYYWGIIAILFLYGCSKDDNSDFYNPAPDFKREWYSVVKMDTIDSADLMNAISGYRLPTGVPIVLTTFLYHSVQKTDTLTLSGSVSWPTGTESCEQIWLDNHHFTIRWNECPSYAPQPGMVFSTNKNAICIAPDYQGLGLSRNLPSPYLNTALLANQSLDCFKAALSLVRDIGPELSKDYYTYNLGFSLGGAVSLGVARQAETDPSCQEFLHLRKSLCGGGPYDQYALFKHFIDTPDMQLEYPVEFPCAIISMLQSKDSYIKEYDLSDLLTPQLAESDIIQKLYSKDYTTQQINSMMNLAGFTTLKKILSENLFDSESQIYKDILRQLDELDLTTGWTPTIPIVLRHSREDTYVPIECLESFKEKMSGNPNITYDIRDSGGHVSDGHDFYMRVLTGYYSLED